MKALKIILAFLLVLLLLAGGGLVYLRVSEASGGEPALSLPAVFAPPSPDPQAAVAPLLLTAPAAQPGSPTGQLLLQAWEQARGCVQAGELRVEKDSAVLPLQLSSLDLERLRADWSAVLSEALKTRVEAASRAAEIYNADRSLRRDVLEPLEDETLRALLGSGDYRSSRNAELLLRYADQAWTAENAAEIAGQMLCELADPDAAAASLLSAVEASLPYLPLHYTIPEDALAGPVPNPEGFGETDDPAVIEALLQRPEAQTLINGQELCWNAGIARIPNTPIRWYLDETILVLVWQEPEARAVGTFSEIFVADGSQLRRKIAGDTPFDFNFESCSRFAQDTNAVLAVGGDFYHHGRACGISVYQREICRFEPETCDVCYITPDGDLLFSYRGQFQTEEEARQFLAENDVLFSLVFGPVLIDDGVDVTPASYAWGEIDDTYARSALGLLGERHYLTMNINCQQPDYYYLATLRQAADAMLRRGCLKAYTLDGGQTATTVFHGQLVNPVQFGWEKEISDIIYFATAVPND